MCNPVEAFTGPDSSAQVHSAAKANKQHQAAIDYGLQQLNAIYGGGSYNQYSQASGAYNPAVQYYTQRNGTYTPFFAGGTPVAGGSGNYKGAPKGGNGINAGGGAAVGGGAGLVIGGPVGGLVGAGLGGLLGGIFGEGSSSPQALNFMKQGKLYAATPSQTFTGYNDNFFNNRARAYENYALPQLAQQYQNTRNALQFNLANRGMLRSSVANKENADLNYSLGQQKQGIADTALGQAQSLRTDVENSRQQAISQLYQTANPAQAQQSALAAASRFSAPSAFAPLANGFANLVNQYAMQQQIAGYQQQPMSGGYAPTGYSSLTAALPENR